MRSMRDEALYNLENNILPFWMKRCVDPAGGFRGRIDGNGHIDPQAPKGAVLNARILWAFSAAYRLLHKTEYLKIAERARREVTEKFMDMDYGGVFWSLDHDGKPLDTKKQIYALGFAIYGLSEFSRATGDKEAQDAAISLYRDIEAHSFDRDRNGYVEALTREWGEIQDMRLSDKDANEKKTMNTHLHIIEPYTALFRIWPDEGLRERIENLVFIFREKIMDRRTGHLKLFFDEDWNSRYEIVSYGHDIEASWLLNEAAEVTGAVSEDLRADIIRIADAASEGYIPGCGMICESNRGNGAIDADRHWWVQAETVIGYLNIYQMTGNTAALERSLDTWRFIRRHIVDNDEGEWVWSLRADGTVNRTDDKAGFWKCPYHDTRMCLEIAERTDRL